MAGRPGRSAGGRLTPHVRRLSMRSQNEGTDAMPDALQTAIDRAWEERTSIGPETKGETREAVTAALELLDSGKRRVAEPGRGSFCAAQATLPAEVQTSCLSLYGWRTVSSRYVGPQATVAAGSRQAVCNEDGAHAIQ